MSTADPSAVPALDEQTSTGSSTAWWSTAISDIHPDEIRLRGYRIQDLIVGARFPDVIWMMVRGDLPTRAQSSLLEKVLVAAVDHGPQAPSIAAARMAATCGVGLQSAIATGVNLLGDVHGGAGEQCLALFERILAARTSPGPAELPELVARELRAIRDRKGRVPGFGHRFHHHDPRRDPLLEAVADARWARTVDGDHLEVALEIERQLGTRGDRGIPINVDGASAVVLGELGFAPPLARGIFVLSRSVGILAHAHEEQQQGTRIKGPLPPPLLADYTGPLARSVDPDRG